MSAVANGQGAPVQIMAQASLPHADENEMSKILKEAIGGDKPLDFADISTKEDL